MEAEKLWTRRIGSTVVRAAKASCSTVSWQHPLVRAGLPIVDVLDALSRLGSADLRALPPYSARIRSRGIHGQFGGRATARSSELFVRFLQDRAALSPDSSVLDVGCGCGLTALACVGYLGAGHYTGIDVDQPSIDACRRSSRLSHAGFRFIHAEVLGDVYTGGETPAESYRFPLPDGEFTHVIMCSVVTHLLPAEVANYFCEAARVLSPGGRLVFSTFLTDYGGGRGLYSFPKDHGHYRLAHEELPRKAVAYRLSYLDETLLAAGLVRDEDPVLGSWRQDGGVPQLDPLASTQDLVLAVRE